MRRRGYLLTLLMTAGVLLVALPRVGEAAVLCTNPGGQISLRDASCRPGEHPVDVASLGVTPNDAYTFHSATPLILASDGRIAALITVPAGSYVVSAWIGFSALGATEDELVACYLPTGTGGLDAAAAGTGAHGEGTLAFHTTYTATAPDTRITMECRTPFAFLSAQIREVRLTAVRVNSISVQ